MTDNCIFCNIINGVIPAQIVYRDEFLVAMHDISPQAPVHLLLVPCKHIPTTLALTAADDELIGRIHRVAAKLAQDLGFSEDGFRLVNNCNRAAGQTVWHLHFHLLAGRDMDWPPG